MITRLSCCLLVTIALLVDEAAARTLTVGSKTFTESVLLGEIVAQQLRQDGEAVRHRRGLGGTRILWRAVVEGEIDLYPEYTGTLVHEILRRPDADVAAIRRTLAGHGLAMTEALGFDNSYALGMRAERAQEMSIERISDLVGHVDLRFGFSNEFMDRADGWPGLRARYGLPQRRVTGIDHDLAYRGLAAGSLDVIDVYRTDAEIAYYRLQVLADDRSYFPGYEAVYVYRLDLPERRPQAWAALQRLAGSIDADEMRRLNARVKLGGESEAAVAADWLGLEMPKATGFWRRLSRRTFEHLALVGASLGLALLVALPLGIVAARRPRLGQWLLSAAGVLQTLPSLAVFVFMIPLFGIGAAPAIAALFLYSLLPIIRNTHAGLVGIPIELRETAAAIGLSARTRLFRIELPLATGSILAGIKIAAVINVGTATLGALIGAGGYGQPILTGIRLDDPGLIFEGAIPAALLALAVQGGFELIERRLQPQGLRLATRH